MTLCLGHRSSRRVAKRKPGGGNFLSAPECTRPEKTGAETEALLGRQDEPANSASSHRHAQKATVAVVMYCRGSV